MVIHVEVYQVVAKSEISFFCDEGRHHSLPDFFHVSNKEEAEGKTLGLAKEGILTLRPSPQGGLPEFVTKATTIGEVTP